MQHHAPVEMTPTNYRRRPGSDLRVRLREQPEIRTRNVGGAVRPDIGVGFGEVDRAVEGAGPVCPGGVEMGVGD
jgi:hypothetical protein